MPKQRTVAKGRPAYLAYIASPEWAAMKARYRRSRMPHQCVVCGSKKYDLHHRTYKRLGDERLTDLVALCRTHHDEVHQYERTHRTQLFQATKKVVKAARLREGYSPPQHQRPKPKPKMRKQVKTRVR